jgi:hypothetical protein
MSSVIDLYHTQEVELDLAMRQLESHVPGGAFRSAAAASTFPFRVFVPEASGPIQVQLRYIQTHPTHDSLPTFERAEPGESGTRG